MRENRNVPFRDWNIRVSRNHNGQLHICAVDICDILKRDELLENGAIARVCPTALKISFRKTAGNSGVSVPSICVGFYNWYARRLLYPVTCLMNWKCGATSFWNWKPGSCTPSRRTTSSCTSRKGSPSRSGVSATS